MPQDQAVPPTALERGDILPEDDIDPENPDAEVVAAELEAELETDKEDKEEKESKKDSRIPEARHKAILEKEREKRADLERQLAQYQNGQQVATVNEQITAAEDSIMKMERQHAELLTDGEIDKAVALMSQIRRAERDMAEAKSDMKIHAAEIRATERARYNTGLERIEAAYPELNPDHEDYSEELMAEVAELKDAYQMKGLTPTVALQKAVKALVEPRTTKQEMATSTTPRVNEKDVAAERKAAAVAKTEKAVRTAPPSLARTGIDSSRMGAGANEAQAVMSMSQAEFKKFAEANPEAMARMRGDTI
jgi:hypothetical protein